jgi:hypothetical protein
VVVVMTVVVVVMMWRDRTRWLRRDRVLVVRRVVVLEVVTGCRVMRTRGARSRLGDQADRDRGHTGRGDNGQGCQASAEAASEHCTHLCQPFRPPRKRSSRARTNRWYVQRSAPQRARYFTSK